MLIQARREEIGKTAQQVADDVGVSRPLVSQWESGLKPVPKKRLGDLAAALEWTVADLVGATRYVKTEEDVEDWLLALVRDHETPFRAVIVLLGLPDVMNELGCEVASASVKTFTGSIGEAATFARSLTAEEVADVWPLVLDSGYVERIGNGTWTLALKFPESE